MKVKRIPYVVYPFDLIVFTGGNRKKISKYLKAIVPKNIKDEINDINFKCIGHTFMFSSGQTIIRLCRGANAGTVAHEIFHAVDFLFRRIRIKLSENSDEAYTYLIGYITNQYYTKKSKK